ncbi:MAG: ParB N-terminal domain-containing protein [Nanoarchaeales archaeon]
MDVEWVKIEKLIPYQKELKEHLINEIKESIKRFGFTVPIITDENYNILAGHGRYYAVIQLRNELSKEDLKNIQNANAKYTLEKILDGYVLVRKIFGLSEEEKIIYRIVDNILTIKGNIKRDALADEISKLHDKNIIGMSMEEINELIKDRIGYGIELSKALLEQTVENAERLKNQEGIVQTSITDLISESEEEREKEIEYEKKEENIDVDSYFGYSTEKYINIICPYCRRVFNVRREDIL